MKIPSMVYQVKTQFDSMAAYGSKKWMHKVVNGGKPFKDVVYSYSTMRAYKENCIRFAKWAKRTHGCRYVQDARQYAGEYLNMHKSVGHSAWTVRAYASAIAKLYQCRAKDFGVTLPPRLRKDVKRSRTGAEQGHYSEANNAGLHEIGRDSGLRRCELVKLRPEVVFTDGQGKHFALIKGKGGKVRFSPCLGDGLYKAAVKAMEEGKEYIWQVASDTIPSRIPEHMYRAEYAQALYESLARDPATLSKSEQYICRRDRKGIKYDRAALRAVSAALGHNRLNVVTSYIK